MRKGFSQTTIKVRAVAAIHEVIQGTKQLNTQRKGAWSEFTKATPLSIVRTDPFTAQSSTPEICRTPASQQPLARRPPANFKDLTNRHSGLTPSGWALNVFWLPVFGRRACTVRSTRVSTRQASPHPDWTGHAGSRWVTERITSPLAGEETHPNQNRNDRHERHHGHRPTRKEKTASRKRRSWLPEIFLPLDRSR